MSIIEHTGDVRPVPATTKVRVWLEGGCAYEGRADEFCWRRMNDPREAVDYYSHRILRYEVLETPEEPGPAADTNPLSEAVAFSVKNIHQTIERIFGSTPATTAPELLQAAAKHMADRAATYDQPEGERSMATTVKVFALITGRELRESEGWLLMEILKLVRSEQRAAPHRDSIEDNVAYAALYGEARLGGR